MHWASAGGQATAGLVAGGALAGWTLGGPGMFGACHRPLTPSMHLVRTHTCTHTRDASNCKIILSTSLASNPMSSIATNKHVLRGMGGQCLHRDTIACLGIAIACLGIARVFDHVQGALVCLIACGSIVSVVRLWGAGQALCSMTAAVAVLAGRAATLM